MKIVSTHRKKHRIEGVALPYPPSKLTKTNSGDILNFNNFRKGFSALPMNFCNKKQEIEAGTWVAGIARFSSVISIFIIQTILMPSFFICVKNTGVSIKISSLEKG